MLKPADINPCELIPHAGGMCLLERVVSYDDESITCVATSHRDGMNPLRSENHLPAISGIEYAAQAMAIHGGLTFKGSTAPSKGFLASARGINLAVERLDDLAGELVIQATQLAVIADAFSYEFSITSAWQNVMNGRLSIKVLIGE